MEVKSFCLFIVWRLFMKKLPLSGNDFLNVTTINIARLRFKVDVIQPTEKFLIVIRGSSSLYQCYIKFTPNCFHSNCFFLFIFIASSSFGRSRGLFDKHLMINERLDNIILIKLHMHTTLAVSWRYLLANECLGDRFDHTRSSLSNSVESSSTL